VAASNATTTEPRSLAATWRAWWDFERERTSGGGPVARIGQLVRHGDVLRELIIRELKSSYGGSVLGYAWTLFSPLSMIAVYWLVFGRVAKFNLHHYPLFIAAGMMPWMYFNGLVNSSMRALRSNGGIIRTINMPREIFPLTTVGESCVEYLLSLPVVFLLGLVYGVLPDRYLPMLLVSVVIETMLLIGLALLLSSIATLVQDTQRVIRPLLRVMFYLSPIIYPVSRVHGTLLTLYKLNPLVGIVELNRLVWYPHYLVTPPAIFQHAAISAGVSVVVFILGWSTFMRLEPAALKEL
jgi:ABC-2 type transport system permease protein